MKRYFFSLLLLCNIGAGQAFANIFLNNRTLKTQNSLINKHLDTTTVKDSLDTEGIKVGEKVPDVLLSNILNYKSAAARLSDFKGKLVILDFWATWCMPCISMIPKMNSLQKEFDGKIQFLPVAYQSSAIVKTFLTKYEQQNNQSLILPDVTDEKTLLKLFPHRTLPHFVWIDGNGTVIAITDYDFVDKPHIEQYLQTGKVTAKLKFDPVIPFNRDEPFLLNGNGGNGDNLIYHSLLAAYKDGLPGTVHRGSYEPGKPRRVFAINVTLGELFATAYGADDRWFGDRRRVFLTKDTSKFLCNGSLTKQKEWIKAGNAYSYEILVPAKLSGNLFPMMREELHKLFPQYDVSVQKMPVKCLALMRTSSNDKIGTKGGEVITDFDKQGMTLNNSYLNQFVARLDIMYLQSMSPVVDATGYLNPVDMEIDANLTNLKQVNEALAKYDLVLKESVEPVEMLVFKDSVPGTK